MADLASLFACRKSIAFFPGWSPPEPETDWICFSAPLAVDGIVEPGLQLFGGCFKTYPNENVTFELLIARTPTSRRTAIERFDWKSLQGGHSNKRGRPEVIPRRTVPTHIHSFELNFQQKRSRMIEGLPLADNVASSLETFESVRTFVGSRLNISNIDVVAVPEWEYNLFHGSFSVHNKE
jgi:hypothetical protein